MLRELKSEARSTVHWAVFCAAKLVGTYNGTYNYRKFLVLTRPRTGSNMLVSMLSNNRSVIAKGELLARTYGRPVNDLADYVISELFCRYPRFIKAAGFKLMYNHPFDAPSSNAIIWQRLQMIDDLHVIHLKRRNILRAEVSNKIALQRTKEFRKLFPLESISVERRRVCFTPAELLKLFEWTRGWEHKFDRELQALPHLQVAYEDVVARPQEQFDRINFFLGVNSASCHTELQRQNPEPLSELVMNYRELKDCFGGTPWSEFFVE